MWEIKDGKAKWKASLTVGEVVSLMGSSEKAVQGNDGEKEYVSISRSDRSEGWIRPIYLAKDAIAGVVIGDKSVIYSQPKNTNATARVIGTKQIIAVYKADATDAFLKIATYDPIKQDFVSDVFIRKDEVSTLEADAQTAIILQVAAASKNADQRNALLSSALKDYPNSRFAEEIRTLQAGPLVNAGALTAIEEFNATMVINDNNVNIRSKADTAGDVVSQLSKDAAITVIARTVEPATIDGKSARWYHLSSPADGWVFGGFIEGAD